MTLRHLAAASAAVFLLACGSSSKTTPPPRSVSYGGPTGAVSLDASADTTTLAVSAMSVSQVFTGMSGLAFGYAAGVQGALPARPLTIEDVLRMGADARHRTDLVTVAGALATASHPCPTAGSFAVTCNDQDGTASTTQAGDYVRVAFAGCTDGAGVIDGAFQITFDATSGDDFVASAASITTDRSYGLTLAFDQLFVGNTGTGAWNGFDGDLEIAYVATVSSGTITAGFSGTSFEGASGVGNRIVAGFRISPLVTQPKFHDTGVQVYTGMSTAGAALAESRWDLDARVCTVGWGGCLNVETDPTFRVVEPNQYPSAGGALTVSDDLGRYVKVTAGDPAAGACTLSWSLPSSTGSWDTTWAALEAAASE